MTRATTNDWLFETVELNNFVDMNRLWVPEDYIDPYDFSYWSKQEKGVDCNGKVGQGYYCFC